MQSRSLVVALMLVDRGVRWAMEPYFIRLLVHVANPTAGGSDRFFRTGRQVPNETICGRRR